MGFFRDLLRKANNQPTDSEMRRVLEKLQAQIRLLQSLALELDRVNDSDDDISLFAQLQIDLMSFSLHIAASDNRLDANEVDAINLFLGTNLSYSDCKVLIEEGGLGDAFFNSSMPTSFVLLAELARTVEKDVASFGKQLATTYQMLGMAIAAIDGDFDAREKRDLDNYISMLNRYVATL